MPYTEKDHIFAVCAYKESPYLTECIESLRSQTRTGRIIICTSTPNSYIGAAAARYGLPVFTREGAPEIAADWNYALQSADASLVTLAHQDDVYESRYLERVLEEVNRAEMPLIAFTGYYELRDGERVDYHNNRNLMVKQIMLLPLRPRALRQSRWVRRRTLSLGCPICCPSVTYVKDQLPDNIFETRYRSDLDWQAWERLSKRKGAFCYVPELLMGHRIHEESTTTKVIGDARNRSAEDLEMYRKFWPEGIARLLNRAYSVSQESNRLEEHHEP